MYGRWWQGGGGRRDRDQEEEEAHPFLPSRYFLILWQPKKREDEEKVALAEGE